MGERAVLLGLSPGVGSAHSRLQTSSHKTAAFQRVLHCTEEMALPALIPFTESISKHVYWMFSSLRGKVLKSSKLCVAIVETYIKLSPLSVILSRVSKPRLWGGWWEWYLSPLPVKGFEASVSIFWSTELLLPARCCQQLHSWCPRKVVRRSPGSL